MKAAGNSNSLDPAVTAPVPDSTDLDSAIFEINAKQRPIGESIIDGLAKIAARQIAAGLFEEDQSAVQTLANWTTLAHAHSGAFPWTRPAAAQVLLDAIEMSDLTQDPSTTLRCLLARFVEVASRVGPASGQGNFAFLFSDKAPVGHVGIALQGPLEVCCDHVLEAVGCPARFPAIDDIAPRGERCPEVAEFGLAVARRQIADRGLVNLKVSSGHDPGADLLIDGSKPIGGQSHPASHGLPRQVNLVAVSKNGFLPVERKVIAELADDDLRQKSRRRNAALLQARRQCRDQGRRFRVPAPHVFASHQSPAQEPSGFVVELFADLRTDQAPILWRLLHFLGIDDLLDNRQVRRPSLPRAGLAPCFWFVPRVSLLQRGGVDFSRFVLRSHQKEIKLVGVQLLARAAEHAPDEQVHLLAKQFDFLTKTSVLFAQLLILSKKLLFAQFLHCL